MNILAVETSTELCSAALLADGEVTAREAEAGQAHSSLLLPMVAALLRERGITFDALDGVAFGAGPGSFTGLRIACGVAQGLAVGAQTPVVGVSTLEALAEEAWLRDKSNVQIVACLDARMAEVYHAAYRREGGGWRVCSAPGLFAPESVPVLGGGSWTGAGSGFALYGAALRERQQLIAQFPGLRPHARTIAALALPRFVSGATVVPEQALPVYLRDKVAQTVRERRA